jgi:DnaJ-class molecular chaperone
MSSPNQKKSLYEILGVNKSDSCNDIKKTYLKLARTHHPDKGGDPEVFKEILRASEILTDEGKRRMYDELGIIEGENGGMPEGGNPFHNAAQGSPFPFPFEINLNNLFGGMFGNPPVGPNKGPIRKGKKPAPTIQTFNITFEQFYLGHTLEIPVNRHSFCPSCDHSGVKSKETCKTCNGRGAISQVVQMGPMAMHTTGPCTECQATGERVIEKCDKCSGSGFLQEKRTLSVKINPGTRSGETYIFPEVCSDHPAFERPGDAHIIIVEDINDPAFKYFKRVGDGLQHLETTVSLSLSEALMGCVVQIDGHPGYDEGLFVKIPPSSFTGDKYCLSGIGMPIPGNIGKCGDLYINIDVTIKPTERKLLSTEGRELLAPLFEDKVRTTECPEDSIQTDLYLYKN